MLERTKKWIESKPIEYRKNLGQYFTPDSIKSIVFELLPQMDNAKVLEPSVGTGEFIPFIFKKFNNCNIDAYDIDKDILEIVTDDVNKVCQSFLELDAYPKYDFIIGNPPYYEYIPDIYVRDKYKDIISGRVNIYGLFVKQAIDFLKDGGYLAFVIPTSMNNGKYFEKLREYIIQTCEVEHIVLFDNNHFKDALQNVQILILRKSINTGKNIFNWKGLTFLTSDYLALYEVVKNKITLKEAGYEVKTGTITWNQHKDKLTDDNTKTKLIWSNNLRNDNIVDFSHPIKKQYINIDKSDKYPALLVNRITGVGSNLNLKCAFIDEPFLAENHVNVIKPIGDVKIPLMKVHSIINTDEAKFLLKKLMGNTQVSKTELENLILFKK